MPEPVSPTAPSPAPTGAGPGRLLVWLYGVFTVAAGARSAVQISTGFGDAPVAYLLSALAAAVYAVMTVTLARGGPTARRISWAGAVLELTGVLAVGTVSFLAPDAFPDATVWSHFGSGYVCIPLALPIAGLLWLRRTGAPDAAPAGSR
ncbi:hypothetical protein AQ490_15580 [Wenjunlia vitaminophila]|uniref:Integral membrane protein n=1 Tax=Wenjunlia vitaminophila TaxID=76728 RepID=A0A0T6LWH6_WENVI|nr:hypothetical protein [Wenjunlia vitaminophila]KRV50499.1 hypothetical protein AQ490_15580 [Wenjunlia vitaminophila]